MICRQNNNEPLAVLLRRLNPVLRGWATYFRAGCPPRRSNTCPSTHGNG
ncbi:group II intron maturase-specific domain-containing protein [Amycolatopsis sp. NPDC059090]